MQTIEQNALNTTKSLPPGCALPKLRSLLLEEARRETGRTLYEILGRTELVRVAYEKDDLEGLQQRLAAVLADAAMLQSMVASLVELSRLETGRQGNEPTDFNVVALLQEVAQSARLRAGSKPVVIMDAAETCPLHIRSDLHKIRQIMTELAHNAVKFTERGRIALIVARENDRLRMMVTDTGRGMDRDELSLFLEGDDRLFTGRSVSPDRPALGLSIVKRLVRSLDGTLSATSKPGEGTIVEVVLPLLRMPFLPSSAADTGSRLVRA
jgi:signal transduction histidine kinase